jgi:diamine N-acetyltransferase
MISSDKIKLRALEPEDIDNLYIWENNYAEWEYSDNQIPFSRYTLERYIENATNSIYSTRQLRLVIEDNNDQCCIGFLDFFDFDPLNQRMAVGILIGEEKYRRKGFALEAILLGWEYSRKTFGIEQLYCHITENNKASIALFQKAGFEIVGRLKHWKKIADIWHDVLILQLISNSK